MRDVADHALNLLRIASPVLGIILMLGFFSRDQASLWAAIYVGSSVCFKVVLRSTFLFKIT